MENTCFVLYIMNILVFMNMKHENFFKVFGTFKMQFLDVLYSIHLLLKVLNIKMYTFFNKLVS